MFTRLDRLPADLKRASFPGPLLIMVGSAIGWSPSGKLRDEVISAIDGAHMDDTAGAARQPRRPGRPG